MTRFNFPFEPQSFWRGPKHQSLVLLTVLLGAVLLITPAATESIHQPEDSRTWKIESVDGYDAAAGQALVKFREGTTKETITAVVADLDAKWDVPVGGAGTRLVASRSKDAATLVRDLAARADVVYAEPNYVAHGGVAPNDALYPQLYGMNNTGQNIQGQIGVPGAQIDAEGAWDVSTGNRDNVVAVLDSGIDYNHPDLAANVWSAPADYSVTVGGQTINCPAGSHGYNFLNYTCDPLDDLDHGSHVSGTIGAVGNNGQGVAGVNWTANILAVKWLNSNNQGFISDAINSIEFAIQAKIALAGVNGANVRVLNNSWFANSFSQAVGDEIIRTDANNMLFVALAGNNGTDNDVIPRTPSGHKVPNIIGVSATDNRDALAGFSNFGKTTINLGAPGVNVLSSVRNGGYSYFSGTSMATPQVAGAATLLLSRCSMTTAGVKGIILTNTDAVASLANKNTTGGRLNVNKAIHACAAVTNVADNAPFFVRQHYVDFFSREPDQSGLAFWTNQITECQQPGASCDAAVRRINVSAAFFLSIEFQETGYLVYRMYKTSYGNIAGTPVPVRLAEFLPDTQQIGKDVVVGQLGWEQQLENNKVAFAQAFVSRARFTTAYPTSLTPAQFVDVLFANGGVTPATTDRDAAINEFGGAGNTSDAGARARSLRRVAENSLLKQQENNRAFVLMQYFGYLRRNPNDPPEANLDFGGYNFWLGKLNQFNGNFVSAEMVKAFIISGEYRQRFGP
ncbi:MAG TPA: S8 family serine peptidase [Pyrinomonadaceae bacterium]|jgi:subtilisin family serine protease|nr:S8 family serine peptidase [Pyrinomonadaceae bacterium]